jgi:putative acetyltransferase
MNLRDERPSDAEAIERVTVAAFTGHPYSRQTEHFIIAALRAAGALAVSLVAQEGGEVVGHIAFSPVSVSDGSRGWYGAGPVSVLPERQRRGVGQALVREGLARVRALGGRGCVLVGDPDYYRRFGFRSPAGLSHDGVPRANFMALPFGPDTPRGKVQFHPAFAATA